MTQLFTVTEFTKQNNHWNHPSHPNAWTCFREKIGLVAFINADKDIRVNTMITIYGQDYIICGKSFHYKWYGQDVIDKASLSVERIK